LIATNETPVGVNFESHHNTPLLHILKSNVSAHSEPATDHTGLRKSNKQ